METLHFWRDAEARFRGMRDLDPRHDLHGGHSDADPVEFCAECGEHVQRALQTPGCPLDDIYWLARRHLRVAVWLVDGEYISQWSVSGGPSDRMKLDTLHSRFRADAALAARAAGVVRQEATDDEAVDNWLDLLRDSDSPFYRGDEFPIIEDLLEASSVQCATLAAAAYRPQSVTVHGALKPTRVEFVETRLRDKGWSTLDWAGEAKVDFNTANNYLRSVTKPRSHTLKKLAEALGVPVDEMPA